MFRRIRFLVPVLLFMMSSIAYAAAGDSDTFGTSNRFVTYDSGRDDFGRAVVVQVDGEIVAAPERYDGVGQSKPPALVATEDEVRQFFANYVERCARKEIDGFLSLFSPKAVQNQRDGFDEITRMYSDFFNQSQELRYRLEDMRIDIYQNAVNARARYRVDQTFKKGGKKRIWEGHIRWILVREDGALRIRYLEDSVEGSFLRGSLANFISKPGYRLEKSAMRGESGGFRLGEGGNGSDSDDSSGNSGDSGSGGGGDESGGGGDESGGGDDGSGGSGDESGGGGDESGGADEGDHDRGHGNDPDDRDVDNPGKKK